MTQKRILLSETVTHQKEYILYNSTHMIFQRGEKQNRRAGKQISGCQDLGERGGGDPEGHRRAAGAVDALSMVCDVEMRLYLLVKTLRTMCHNNWTLLYAKSTKILGDADCDK